VHFFLDRIRFERRRALLVLYDGNRRFVDVVCVHLRLLDLQLDQIHFDRLYVVMVSLMVGGVHRHIDGDGRRERDVGVPNHQFDRPSTRGRHTGIAGKPFPVYFFMIAPSGPFDVP
jgi:hypothetical protein